MLTWGARAQVYVVVRPKRGVTPAARLAALLRGPVFHLLRPRVADVAARIELVEADIEQPGFGLSREQRLKLARCGADWAGLGPGARAPPRLACGQRPGQPAARGTPGRGLPTGRARSPARGPRPGQLGCRQRLVPARRSAGIRAHQQPAPAAGRVTPPRLHRC